MIKSKNPVCYYKTKKHLPAGKCLIHKTLKPEKDGHSNFIMNPNLVKETQKTMDKAHKIVNIESEQLQSLIDALYEIIDRFQKPQVESDYFTTKELADYLQVTLPTVYKYVAKKEIPYTKLGRFVRFKKTDIEKWLADKQKHPTM